MRRETHHSEWRNIPAQVPWPECTKGQAPRKVLVGSCPQGLWDPPSWRCPSAHVRWSFCSHSAFRDPTRELRGSGDQWRLTRERKNLTTHACLGGEKRLLRRCWESCCQFLLFLNLQHWERMDVRTSGDCVFRDMGSPYMSPALQADSLPPEPPGKPRLSQLLKLLKGPYCGSML